MLDKAVGVLHAIAESPCGLAELCERTGLPRATAHRLAAGLEVHRLLARDDEGRWRLGPALVELAGQVNDPLLAAGAAVLPRLREITGESVQLYRREGTSRICVVALEPPAGLRDTVPVGARLPMTRGVGRQGAARLQRAATQQAVLPDGEVHRPRTGGGAQARLGAERCRTRARSGERVRAGARRAWPGDRGGIGVGTDRPDRPPAGCALGGGPARRRGCAAHAGSNST